MSRRPSGCFIAFGVAVVIVFVGLVGATLTDGYGAGKRAREAERAKARAERAQRRAAHAVETTTTSEAASTSTDISDPCAGKGSFLGYMEARGEKIPICGSHSNSTGVPVGSTPGAPPSGGTVHVDGYTRKDGTYVAPHTRSAPRRD